MCASTPVCLHPLKTQSHRQRKAEEAETVRKKEEEAAAEAAEAARLAASLAKMEAAAAEAASLNDKEATAAAPAAGGKRKRVPSGVQGAGNGNAVTPPEKEVVTEANEEVSQGTEMMGRPLYKDPGHVSFTFQPPTFDLVGLTATAFERREQPQPAPALLPAFECRAGSGSERPLRAAGGRGRER